MGWCLPHPHSNGYRRRICLGFGMCWVLSFFFSSMPWQLFLKLSLSYTKRVYFHFLAWPMFSLYSQPFDSYRTQFPLDHSFFPSLPGISLSPFCVFWSGSFFSRVDPSAWAILPLLISKVYFILMVFISYPCVLDAEFLMESSRVPPPVVLSCRQLLWKTTMAVAFTSEKKGNTKHWQDFVIHLNLISRFTVPFRLMCLGWSNRMWAKTFPRGTKGFLFCWEGTEFFLNFE